jgi:hypothetical protein
LPPRSTTTRMRSLEAVAQGLPPPPQEEEEEEEEEE